MGLLLLQATFGSMAYCTNLSGSRGRTLRMYVGDRMRATYEDAEVDERTACILDADVLTISSPTAAKTRIARGKHRMAVLI